MAIVSLARADYVRPNVRIGGSKKPRRVASETEAARIRKGVQLLNEALAATDEKVFLFKLSEVMKLARDLWRARSD